MQLIKNIKNIKEMEQIPHTQLNSLKEFEFAKTAVMAGITHTGEMVALRPCVENLGLNWSGQLQAIRRNSFLDQLCVSVKAYGTDGKKYDMICLPPGAFQEWLWSLSPKSENFNTELWEEYKKGLVIHLLMMLKVTLEEVSRLRDMERDFHALRNDTLELMRTNEERENLSSRVRELGKEYKAIQDRIMSRVSKDPNQLSLINLN
jgi:hypothetical protein